MKIFNEKIKTILISSLGAFLCIYAIAYLNLIDESNVWLIPPFGASLVLVMAVHDSPLASPRNVFFGHVLSASSGVMIYYFFGLQRRTFNKSWAMLIIITSNHYCLYRRNREK